MADIIKMDPNGKKAIIIEAAIKVFSRDGFHNTRMEAIALAAGIGKGTIYEYFSSKVQLFEEMMDLTAHTYYKSLSAQNIRELNFSEQLAIIIEAHFRFCQENKELTRLLFWDNDILDKDLKEWGYNFRHEKEAKMQMLVEAGIKKGQIRDVDSKILTLIIAGFMGAVWMPVVLDNWEIDTKAAVEEIVSIILQGIANHN